MLHCAVISWQMGIVGQSLQIGDLGAMSVLQSKSEQIAAICSSTRRSHEEKSKTRDSSFGGTADGGLVIARNGTKSNIDAVGAIDRDDRERELDQFFLAELRSRERKDVVRDVALGK